MAERYEDIIHNGTVIGRRLVSDAIIDPEPATRMKKLAFMRRFTTDERIAIRSAARTDPIIDDGQRLLDWAEEVDLADPDTKRLVDYFGMIGAITPERATQILTP